MPTSTLTDLQTLILATASTREDWHVFPLSETAEAKRQTRSLQSLLTRGLVERVVSSSDEQIWKTTAGAPIGLVLTRAGREAVDAGTSANADVDSVREPCSATADDTRDTAAAVPPLSASNKAGTKQALVLDLLARAEGATLEQMVAATGWLPHTTRAALTGLRKKGHAIGSDKSDGVRTYRTTAAS